MGNVITVILEYVQAHQALLGWLSVVSALTFIGTLLAIPWLIIRIPPDYFSHPRQRPREGEYSTRTRQVFTVIIKNMAGFFFLVIGLIMLLIPGQGLLTILLGLILMNFPGKYQLEQWLIRRRRVLPFLNRLRRRAHRRPLVLRQ
ncbi:MAG: PGPGW domain-containing protein [Desulfosudaceae bacterium]